MKFNLISLGCSKNTSDSEEVANYFCTRGWDWCNLVADADLVMINTCGFINDAKEESLTKIMQVIRQKKTSTKLAVFGCLVKRYKTEIKENIPEIDFLFDFLTISDMDYISDQLFLAHGKSTTSIASLTSLTSLICAPQRFFAPPHIGILKIAEGCNNRCSYCAIPSIRGNLYSIDEQNLFESAQLLADSGAIELSVVAQDTTKYGTDTKHVSMLPQLLKKLSQIDSIKWIRLHYLYPGGLTQKFLDELFATPKVVPYFDIPLQHVSPRILKLMNRNYSQDFITKLLTYIRKTFKDAVIRTTFIVGFPTETEEEFQSLLDYIEENHFDRLGAFAYSTEDGTAAKKIKGKINKIIKQERLDRIMTLQQLLASEHNVKLLGKELPLLIDKAENNKLFARTQGDAYEVDNLTTIFVDKDHGYKPGQIITAKIISTDAYDFVAEIIK